MDSSSAQAASRRLTNRRTAKWSRRWELDQLLRGPALLGSFERHDEDSLLFGGHTNIRGWRRGVFNPGPRDGCKLSRLASMVANRTGHFKKYEQNPGAQVVRVASSMSRSQIKRLLSLLPRRLRRSIYIPAGEGEVLVRPVGGAAAARRLKRLSLCCFGRAPLTS